MSKMDRIRYDPLYRVISESNEMSIIEGRYKEDFDRLKRLNNLGLIPEKTEMAKHSKYKHYSGCMYQIDSLLDSVSVDFIPERYRLPLKVSAIFMHISHLPFTYSTERSLLLACNLDDNIKDYVEKLIYLNFYIIYLLRRVYCEP